MFVAAGLLVLTWPPFEVTWLAWVALVPFLLAIERAPDRLHAAIRGVWLMVVFGAATLWPIAHAFGSYQEVGSWGGLFAAALTALVFQLVWPLFAVFRQGWPRHGAGAAVGAAALYASLDALVPKPFGDTLGLALFEHAWLRQVADLGGPWVLTFVLVLANEAVFRIVVAPGPGGARAHRRLGWVAAATVVGATLYGAARHAEWSNAEQVAPGRLSVAIVQGAVPLEVRRQAATGDDPTSNELLQTYLELSRTVVREGRPDLVVWPETAYPGLFRQPFTESQAKRNVAVDRFVQEEGQALALGSYTGRMVDGELVQYNAIVVLTPGRGGPGPVLPDLRVYEKRELLPFGETVPLLGDSDTARAWFPHVSFFGRGPGPAALALPVADRPVTLGPTVCYEDMFARIPLAEVDLGAEVLLNASHDGWFGPGLVRRFHLAHAVFRSVEARRPQIRAVTSGISAVISSTGDLMATGPSEERAVVRGAVATGLQGTSPVRWGGTGLALAVGLGMAAAGFGLAQRE